MYLVRFLPRCALEPPFGSKLLSTFRDPYSIPSRDFEPPPAVEEVEISLLGNLQE